MKFSYQLLKSWLDLKLSPQELSDLIYLHITEVESITTSGKWANFVVGEILNIAPHPNADKLQLTKVDVGGEVLDIVCGAHNIAVGQKVPVATIGAVLPDGTTIRSAVIRGERSSGMLCSQAELGRTGDASGIMILDSNRTPGTSLSEVLGEEGDSVLDLKILANRPDYISYKSLAREITTVLKQDFTPPINIDVKEAGGRVNDFLQVTVQDSMACPRYMARVIQQVSVGPSPDWMQSVLLSSGLRPINNIVDAANYVMLELGNPIHTFDYDKISGKDIVVRMAKPGEALLGLDGTNYKLNNQMLVIANAKQPLAVAGIIGGEGSGVTDATQSIVIEVANFDLVSIRNTSRRLGLRTDASGRFERGLDIFLPELALKRITNLIQELCPGCKVIAGLIDVHQKLPPITRALTVSPDKINQLLGIEVPIDEMVDILNRLDLPATLTDENLTIEVPHYRTDIEGVADIAEEIIRIYGTDQVPAVMPKMELRMPQIPEIVLVSNRIKELLIRLGLIEIYTHPFDQGTTGAVELANPLSSEGTHLKTELTNGLAQLEFGRSDFRVFELSTVFAHSQTGLPNETQQLAIRVREKDAYRIGRGLVDMLLDELGVSGVVWREVTEVSGLRLVLDQTILGELTEHGTEAIVTLDVSALVSHVRRTKLYRPLPKYPVVKMDMAFFIPDRIRIADLVKDIWGVDPLVDKVELFDIFNSSDRGRSSVGSGQRSVAFHIELRSPLRTLTKEDRERVADIVENTLLERHKARLRDE